MKRKLTLLLEWLRPAGIALAYFLAEYFGADPAAKFHILGPVVVMLMSGTVAFEALALGEAASEKIGYKPDRAYQVQSGLNQLAIALAALCVLILDWGRYADAAVTLVMLITFALSAANHVAVAIKGRDFKPANLMRPILTLLLAGVLIPPLIAALQ